MSRTHIKYERNVMNLSRIAAKAAVAGSLVVALAGAGRANEIKGKVSVQGIKSAENIAVYVDAIADKKFDAPKDHIVIDQRKMAFLPHLIAVQQGTTVEFLNSDPVGHNVYWPSISGNKSSLIISALGRRARRNRSNSMTSAQLLSFATCIRKCPAMSSLFPLRILQ